MKQQTMIKRTQFIRTKVNHYSFLTGLLGKLNGKSGGPEDSGQELNVILQIVALHNIDKNYFVTGVLFECIDFLTFINGSYDATDLSSLKSPDNFKKPTKFDIETWETEDGCRWQFTKKTIFDRVRWIKAKHSGDGGSRACAGIATFSADFVMDVVVNDGPVILLSNTNPARNWLYLKREIQKTLPDPKHPSNYMG